ncbi:putative lipoprotein [Cupriavidus sp. U2]|nr:putative lipoprotein [Cupriavidus sp. U2]
MKIRSQQLDLPKFLARTLAILPMPFLVVACGGGDGGNDNTTSINGTLHVAMTDAPACGFDHVFVTVSKVRVNASTAAGDNDGGWTDIALPTPQRVDLLSLTNGVLFDLGRAPLPAGQYQQIRLVLSANQGNSLANAVVVSGTTAELPLATPSATQSGYKIIQPFTVPANTLVDLILDFNACKSIVQQGNGGYSLKPVVTATPMTVSGSITGFVAPAQAGATVYAEQNGKIVRGTVADASGKFVLTPLVQSSTGGNYDVVIVDNRLPSGHATGIIGGVPVTASATTSVATAGSPITLPTSTTNTVSGTATASAQAAVRALQPIGSASYEIASTNANLDTGAYSLALPAAAPLAGTYSATLPIALSAVSSAAGQYSVQATSAGGATQTSPVNVFNGGQSGVNFSF